MSLKNIFKSMKSQGYVVKPLEKYLLSIPNGDSDRAFNVNAPSSIGKCLRARYYSRVSTEKDDFSIEPRTRRIFDNGTKTHERLQGYLLKAKILLMDEVPVINDFYNIQGHTDGILDLGGGELGILEIKSINDNGFTKLKDCKPEHRQQGLSYAYCIEERRKTLHNRYKTAKAFKNTLESRKEEYANYYTHLKGGSKHSAKEKLQFQLSLHEKMDEILFKTEKPITKVIFLYEDKNDQSLKEFCVDTTDESTEDIIQGILNDCLTVNKCVLKKEPPERSGKNKSDSVCRFCDYKIACWN